MAAEQPQTLPVDQKLPSSVSENQVLDESGTKVVNGHSKSDEDQPKSDEKLTVNGKAELQDAKLAGADDSLNRKAFAANSNLPEQTSAKSVQEPLPTTDTDDTDMPDVNGALAVNDEPVSAEKTDQNDPIESSAADKVPATEQDLTTQEIDSVPEPSADAMDLDNPAEQADDSTAEKSNVEQASTEKLGAEQLSTQIPEAQDANSITAKPVVGDGPPATSSQDMRQSSAALSKLDIGSAQSITAVPQSDSPMSADQPVSAGKVSREREEDGGEERVAKRVKTQEKGPSEPTADSLIVASTLPSASAQSEPVDSVSNSQAITGFQNRQIRGALAGIKKTKNGMNFRQSVEKLWPTLWEEYQSKIAKPVDISMIEGRLRNDDYSNYGELKSDIRLLYENALKFNGESNNITQSARIVRDQILSKLPELSKLGEPSKPEKGKSHPTRHTEPRAATQPRRQSQSQPQVAPSPKARPTPPAQAPPQSPASSSGPAYAIPPNNNGIPQIRRDSTQKDGDRPKRPIHPPKNRDLDYASAKSKKLEPEQRFFEVVLDEVKKGKHFALNQWFLTPVDPVAYNIPTYFSVVKKPMDLDTMTKKNREGHYKTVKDFEKDMKLIVHNSELFNGDTHDVTALARRLEELFVAELAKRDQWMKRHYPPEVPSTVSAPAISPERSANNSEEESEGDNDDDDTSEVIRNLQVRLDEEQEKLNTLLGSKKPDLTMIEIQQQMVSMLQRKLVEERAKTHEEKKPKSKKKNTKSKSKAGGGSAAVTSNKKAATGNASSTKKAPSANVSHKKAASKVRPVGPIEKAVIADGINDLDGNTLTKAVEIIKKDTGQNENDDGEMELDIDVLSMDALRKLYELIHKTNPAIRTAVEKKPEFSSQAEAEPKPKPSAPAKPKKNKPMNKQEQERRIEYLQGLKAQLQRQNSGSQEPVPAEAEDNQPAESSEEESDSEEE
ncbi:Bromodomain-containing protein [Hypoxylon fuscum]|nr:Bromodomain-containing protein [Hypoxylon fuscum]